jgi:hypothetical protein
LTKIQSKRQVNVRFDKQRGILQLSGSEFDVSVAKELVTNLGGQKKTLKASLKAELLRAPTTEGSQSTMKWLRRNSNCAVHIDQLGQEARLVGHSEDVKAAEKLLEELAERCVESVLPTNGATISLQAVEAIESSCGVTIHKKEDKIVVLGLQDSVKKAVAAVNLMIEMTNEGASKESNGDWQRTVAGTGEEVDKDSDKENDYHAAISAGTGDGDANDAEKEERGPSSEPLKQRQPEWAKPILRFFELLKVKDAPYAYCP